MIKGGAPLIHAEYRGMVNARGRHGSRGSQACDKTRAMQDVDRRSHPA